jgi:hypothetical protein
VDVHALAIELKSDRLTITVFLVNAADFANAGVLAGRTVVIKFAIGALDFPAGQELVPGRWAFSLNQFGTMAFFPAGLFVRPEIELGNTLSCIHSLCLFYQLSHCRYLLAIYYVNFAWYDMNLTFRQQAAIRQQA